MSSTPGELPPAPELQIQSVLRQHWDATKTSYDGVPTINTGEYRRGDMPVPAITITGGDEGPIESGPTGYSAMDGAGGGGMQRVGGAVTVDCVAGGYDDLVTAGEMGTALNPKQLRWELYSHAAQLLMDYQEETRLKSISPGDGTKIAEAHGDDNASYSFRIQFRARYLYDRHPNPPTG